LAVVPGRQFDMRRASAAPSGSCSASQAAQHSAEVVVLNKGHFATGSVVADLLIEVLHEESTRVAEHLGFEDDHAIDVGLNTFIVGASGLANARGM
jgi:hypothetical protein